MKILFGEKNKKKDVTNICMKRLLFNNKILIPSGAIEKIKIFKLPMNKYNNHKKITLINNEKELVLSNDYDIIIDISNNKINIFDINYLYQKLSCIHFNLKFLFGNIKEEIPEQLMSIRYLKGNEKVLEIGGNLGRNSLVISSILEDDKNLVVLESNKTIANKLIKNRDINNYNFHIESSALSKIKLIQKSWNTYPSEELKEGFKFVDIISYEELQSKYKIIFDTLVLDCEGAFYYILRDMPEILNNIKLIIMENDYHNIEHKKYIDNILIKNNFVREYKLAGEWGPCKDFFFEVWKK